MRLRPWVGRVLALAVGCALATGLLEVGLRALRPSHSGLRALLYQPTLPTAYGRLADLPGLVETTVVGYRRHTDSGGYVRNGRGLRTREYAVAPAPGVFRIVALGDSFVYGGVAEADHWCAHLERAIASRRTGGAEVL